MVTTGFTSTRGAKQALLTIADLTDLQVEIDITESDIAKVRLQQPATVVLDAYPDRRYQAVVEYIASTADRQKATVRVKVKVLNPDEYMRPDLGAKVTFYQLGAAVTGQEEIVRIPKSAVQNHDGRAVVYVVKDQKAVMQAVTIGAEDGAEVQILEGLRGGEEVIAEGRVKDGDKVEARR
jgi:HlyD family secretion protein